MLRRSDNPILFSLLISLLSAISIFAQPPASPAPVTPQGAKPLAQPLGQPIGGQAGSQDADPSYRLGPGDLLAIRVFGRPELSSETRVDNNGRVSLPFIKELQAACLTEVQLASAITEKYKKYLRDPQVDVLIKEFRSQPVAVIGAVTQPGRFQLQRRVRLLELVTFAGGPNNRAGNFVQVIHSSDHDYCAGEAKDSASGQSTGMVAGQATAQSAGQTAQLPDQPIKAADQPIKMVDGGTTDSLPRFATIKLQDMLAGNQEANPYIQPGDIVSIPEADQFFVTGSVTKPGAYPLTTKITLTQAVAIAGGVNTEGAKNRVRLIRPVPGTEQRNETVYNVDDIQKRKIEDIALQPNDIVEVPGSTARVAQRNLLGVGINMLNTLPFFILR